jgi:hypothetical protein
MAAKPISDRLCRETIEIWEANECNISRAAEHAGVARKTFEHRLRTAQDRNLKHTGEFTAVDIPDDDIPIEELVEHRKKQFRHKQRYEEAVKLIDIQVHVPGPFGILHFGDPHVDDDGTDIIQLERDMNLVRDTEALFGANVGDTTNNWVGRLAALYAAQSTSAKQAMKLAEWFLNYFQWLYIIGGNHDVWPGLVSNDNVMTWLAGQTNSLYQSSEIRMRLLLPNKNHIRINARHDFSGHSMYNPAHGVMKALQFGVRDHLALCGHKHVSGHGTLKDPDTGITMHALQIASYKIYDRYAKEKGFRDQSLSPCAVTVINPDLPQTHPDLIKIFWDSEEGADYLKFKRDKWKRGK